ncbi:MAG TPA: glycoside hydrolase family 3 N-terminal domain-containing protein [Flavipsychrobacter sp.]|nr:glycoside hydrolase family 3 N-terminal domain-containing protein [Flavipsychrobacter sp.]
MLFRFSFAIAQDRVRNNNQNTPAKSHWVDSVYNALNEDERIGQLFMVAAYSGGRNYNEEAITNLINAHQIGGLIFMQGGPVRQAMQTNKYQSIAQVPLLIAMDAEWGLGMRLDSVKDLPKQMALGATRDTSFAYKLGMVVAYQCKRLAVNIDFAPVVDVNNNPLNPVINMRSFGEDKTRVAQMGIAYMHGLQNNGVMACAKHFPGHGDTNVDSHKDLPEIDKSMAQLDTLELYPFKRMIHAGIKSVMVAHLDIPALESEPHVPTTLSKNTVTGLLKDKLGFTGLIFTDALDMKGVTKYFPAGEADMRAFIAGNDVLLFSQDVPLAISKIKSIVDSGIVSQADLEQRVKKILAAKYDAGLAHWHPVDTTNITNDLNQYTSTYNIQLAKGAITLVRDDNGVINKLTRNMRIEYIGVNASETTPLFEDLRNTLGLVHADWLPKGSSVEKAIRLLDTIPSYDAAVIAIHNTSIYPTRNYGLDSQQLSFLGQVQTRKNVIIALMGNAYIMQYFCNAKSVMVAYEDDTINENIVSRMLMKQLKPKGKLPVTPTCVTLPALVVNKPQVAPPSLGELKKVISPVQAGVVDMEALFKLDLFLQRCIVDGAFPGCRVVAAKDGNVFYDKSFGYFDYYKKKAVDSNTLYDVASVTKVLATTLAVMHLYETGKLDLDQTIGHYLPWTKKTDKRSLKIRDVLLHQAGLKAWIPFYKETVDNKGNLRSDLYRQSSTGNYSVQVAKNLYLRNDYVDTIWKEILASPLENKGRYVYSDLDYYFLAEIVERITGERLDKYVDEQFYKPMGLKNITYLPLNKFPDSVIAPTEDDIFFRHQQIHGYVHDPGAAMFGGVAGHAGIFATGDDVAAIFEMLMNKGTYKGKQYFKNTTIDYFTAYNSRLSRRGLGFDKPTADPDDGGPAGDRCTGYAFGHQGFTGTCVWADPATGIVFVFLSNRVCPSADNNKINHLSVRTVTQDYIYEALGFPVNHDRPEVYKQQIGNIK